MISVLEVILGVVLGAVVGYLYEWNQERKSK